MLQCPSCQSNLGSGSAGSSCPACGKPLPQTWSAVPPRVGQLTVGGVIITLLWVVLVNSRC